MFSPPVNEANAIRRRSSVSSKIYIISSSFSDNIISSVNSHINLPPFTGAAVRVTPGIITLPEVSAEADKPLSDVVGTDNCIAL